MAQQPHTILIADDDKEIVDLIALYLKEEGYATLTAENGKQCLALLEKQPVSLLVLDVMMPGMDGIEVCRRLREGQRSIPVIIVSAKSQPMDKVLGLATGADDYLSKPFHPMELVARIKAQLRRFTRLNPGANQEGDREIYLKDLVIHPTQHTVLIGDTPCHLTPKEFNILLLLASNPGKVFSCEALFEQIWGQPALGQDNTVMVHIRKLREKLGDSSRTPKYIHTVWGVGYKVDR